MPEEGGGGGGEVGGGEEGEGDDDDDWRVISNWTLLHWKTLHPKYQRI